MLDVLKRKIFGPSPEVREMREKHGYVEVGTACEAGTKHRNEDKHVVLEDEEVYAVFDGMSSSPRGDRAAQIASEVVQKFFKGAAPARDQREAEDSVYHAILEANNAIFDDAVKQGGEFIREGESTNCSTILVVRVCRPDHGPAFVVCGHVGDSRAYGQLEDGTIQPWTVDHGLLLANVDGDQRKAMEMQQKFSRVKSAAELKDPREQQLYKQRQVVTEIGGRVRNVTPTIRTTSAHGLKGFLLVTDGISDNLRQDSQDGRSRDVIQHILSEGSAQQVAKDLTRTAHARGLSGEPGSKNDDATAVYGRLVDRRQRAPEARPRVEVRRAPVAEKVAAPVRTTRGIERAGSFDALEIAIFNYGEVEGTNETYDPDTLIGMVNEVRANPEMIKTLPRACGIREKVRDLLEIEEQSRAAHARARAPRNPGRR